MSQNPQNSSLKNHKLLMFAKTMSGKEAHGAFQRPMQELATSLQGELVFLIPLAMSQRAASGLSPLQIVIPL